MKARTLTSMLFLVAGMTGAASANATTYGPPTPQAFPLHPFNASLLLTSSTTGVATGTGREGDFGIATMTFANQTADAVQVDVFATSTSGAKCAGTIDTAGTSPDIFVIVPPKNTVQLTFPVPLVIVKLNGQSCIGFNTLNPPSGGSVSVLVTGYQN